MALFQLHFASQYLGNNHTVSVIMPDRPQGMDAAEFYASGKKYRVMWLLHGTGGDHSDWVRKSMVEIYARELNLICVMPSGMNADYGSWPKFATGFDMASYLTKELMPMIYNWLPASDKREDNFITGLSMGAFGALQYAVDNPDKFAGAAMLSGAPEDPAKFDYARIHEMAKQRPGFNRRLNQIENAGALEAYLAGNLWDKTFRAFENGVDLPKLYFSCGTEDKLLWNRYVDFKAAAQAKNLPIGFNEIEGLGHEWRFWDLEIQNVFKYFELDKK